MENQVNDFMTSSIKNLIEQSIVVGSPIIMDNTKIIPISKVKYGFIGAGSNKLNPSMIDCHAGTVSIIPLAVIVYTNEDVKLLHLDSNTHTIEYVVDNIVDIIQEVLKKIHK